MLKMQVLDFTCIFFGLILLYMNEELNGLLKTRLEELITLNKKYHIERVLKHRTRHLTVVLENIHKAHNSSAVLRSIDCFGLQDFYIIEGNKNYRISPHVAKGAGKWVDIHRFNKANGYDTQTCIDELRNKGYKIAVTTPTAQGVRPEEVPLDHKLAIFFGNEKFGLSDTALQAADLHISIPIWGFTESYNVSVSAALIFYTLLNRLHQSDVDWLLTDDERETLRMEWYRKIITRSDVIERELMKTLIKE